MTDLPVETTYEDLFNRFDAPVPARDAHDRQGIEPTVGGSVTGPGLAATVGAGERLARRKADTAGQANHLRHNWVPNGPRNVGGRIRALVVHPNNSNIMYAGGASGGVWKSVDGAQSWFPLWHNEPSLAIGGLAICRVNPRVVWAATGETDRVAGNGIWRTANDGDTWDNLATPRVPGAAGTEGTTFEAIAAHPGNDQRAWAVGRNGIFRTIDGGAHWTQFRAGEHWSDVAYTTNTAGGVVLFLVRAVSAAGEATIVVLPNADDTDVNIGLILVPALGVIPAAHVSTVIAAPPAVPPPPPNPVAGKVAIASANPSRAYVRFANANRGHRGVFRSVNAQLAPPATGSSVTWTQLVDAPGFAAQALGDYALTMAVTPDGQNIATGMVDLHVLTNAHTAPGPPPPPVPVNPWRKAIAWQIWATDRSQHADQHATVFAPDPAAPANLLLWAANDGGISVSRNWQAATGHVEAPVVPIPVGSISWERRSEGLSIAQMYDLGQSPIVPSMVGCGFQDVGVYLTGGGQTWTLVMGADGGHVVFDPDDPYRVLATWHEGPAIVELHVPGLLNRIVQPFGSTVAPWPRSLGSGFSFADLAEFVSETVHHPSQGRSIFHARRNTVYRRNLSSGEVWQPVPLGHGIELRHVTTNPTATLEIHPSSAAGKLGLVPQRMVRPHVVDINHPHNNRALARCHSLLHGPYALADGDQLRFEIDGGGIRTATFRTANFASIDNATAAEVAKVINAVAPGVAQSVCYPVPNMVHLVAKAPATTLTIGGTAAAMLHVGAGAVAADAGHHAVATLTIAALDLRDTELTVKVGAADVVTVKMNDADRPDFCFAADLARLLKKKLDGAAVGVGLHDLEQRVRLTRVGAGNVTETGTARTANAITLTPVPPAPDVVTGVAPYMLQDPANWTVVVGDGANTATVTFNAGVGVADRAIVSAHELRRVTAAAIAAVPTAGADPAVRVDLELDVHHEPNWSASTEGGVSEIAFSLGKPDHIWAGDTSGCLHRSTDGGTTWTLIAAKEMADRYHPVEAIVVHPTEPERVLVGLKGRAQVEGEAGFVFRTTNGGESWNHVGGDMKDVANKLVGANGFDVDPDNPDIVWAATEIGVFRSDNFGGRWEPYNHGLPNAEVIDVVFEPITRTLKVGMWGRGVWERHVGDRPVEDVLLLVRANLLDDGSRPPLRGVDAIAVPPGPAVGSPDIKVTRRLAAAAAGTLLDGVELNERVVHEPPAVGPSTVCVQVHNRGAFSSRNVRVTAAWAALVDGRPPPIGAAFFTDRAAGNLAVDTVHGGWQIIGDGTIPDGGGLKHDVVSAELPHVRQIAYAWPAAAVAARRIAIVAVVSGDGDTSLPSEGDVEELATSNAKIAFRVTETLTADEDRTIVLRSTTGQPFQVVNPTAPVNPAAVLGLPLGAAVATRAVSTTAATFNLAAGATRGFRIQLQSQQTVSLAASPDIANLAAASAAEVVTVLERDLWNSGIPVRGGTAVIGAGTVVGIVAQGAALTRVAGGTAAALLGLTPPGALAAFKTGVAAAAPYNLSVGAPLTLLVDVQHDQQITFPAGTPEITALAAAQAHEIRAAINRQLEHTGIPVVAEPARIELVVRRSLTESVHGGVVGGEQFADLVVAPAAVAAADQAALFDLVTVLQADRAQRNVESRVYVRSANRGNIAVAAVRHRLWSIDPAAAAPFVPAPIGAAVNAAVPPEGTAIVEFRWNPGAVDAGRRFLLLVIADRTPAAVLDPPANFATLDALHAFCLTNPNAAVRMVEIRA